MAASRRLAAHLLGNDGVVAMFICTWNPLVWDWDPGEWERLIDDTRRGVARRDQWSTGSRRQGITPGDDLILLRQGRERGLVGCGSALSEVFESAHYNNPRRTAFYVEVRWNDVVDPADRIPTEELRARVPGVPWNHLQGSGVQVAAESADALRTIWREHRLTLD